MYSLILLKAGKGKRLDLGYNKTMLKLHNKELFMYSVDFFAKDKRCNEIIIVTTKEDREKVKKLTTPYDFIKVIIGGKERQDSVFNGLKAVNNDVVLIHDSARPFLNKDEINNLLKEEIATLACKTKDTVKLVRYNYILSTLDRNELYNIKTPQLGPTKLLINVHKLANMENIYLTDTTALIEKYTAKSVKIVDSTDYNIKITTKEDIKLAEAIMEDYYV